MNLPIDFTNKMQRLLGDEYEEFIKSYDEKRHFGLRVNTLKISVQDFMKISPFEIEKIPWTSTGFYYNDDVRPAKHPYYHAGLYYIQEPSAMAPAEFINAKPGDKVLDLCAAPGGKSTQLATKLAGEGLLVSNDISASRLKAMVKNIELYGVKNAVVINEEPEKLAKKFPDYFDKIVVDAPCSGEGMFRKDEDAGKNWAIHSVEKCSLLQKDIIYWASKMLKVGGFMLYSTCTFSPEEDEQIIEHFLCSSKNFKLVEIHKDFGIDEGRPEWANGDSELKKAARFWPHRVKGEGHFLALLQKVEGDSSDVAPNANKINSKILNPFNEFCKQNITSDISGNFELYGEYLHLLPEGLPSLNGIKVIRPGWFLGMLKKDRFEPSQALAMSIKKHEFSNIVDFPKDSKEVIRYLKGETINISANKGYNLVCVDGFPLGFGKGQEGILKNLYPAGWRWMD